MAFVIDLMFLYITFAIYVPTSILSVLKDITWGGGGDSAGIFAIVKPHLLPLGTPYKTKYDIIYHHYLLLL